MDVQEDKFAAAFDGLDLGGPGKYSYCVTLQTLIFLVEPRPPSFERRRPRNDSRPPPRPEPFPDPRRGDRGNRPDLDVEDDFRRDRRAPPAPEIPGSPTSSHTFSTHSSNINSILNSHWLPVVFNQSRPATLLEDTGQTYVKLSSAVNYPLAEQNQIHYPGARYARFQRKARGGWIHQSVRAVSEVTR